MALAVWSAVALRVVPNPVNPSGHILHGTEKTYLRECFKIHGLVIARIKGNEINVIIIHILV